MNTTKSYKFIILITVFIMSLVAAFTMMAVRNVKADTVAPSVQPEAYFDYGTTTSAKFENDNAVFTLTENGTIKIENTVAVNDFFMQYKAGTGIDSVKVIIGTKSYIVNGNKIEVEPNKYEFHTEITNTLEVKVQDGTAKLNGKDVSSNGAEKIFMRVDSEGYYTASINGVDFTKESDKYYRVQPSNDYNKLTGKVEIEITLKDGVDSADFEIVSLSQKATDDSFLQTFKFTDNKLTEAKPIISLTDSIKVKGDKAIIYNVGKNQNEKTKIVYNVYSFLDGHKKDNTEIKASPWVNGNGNGEIYIEAGDNKELTIVDKTNQTEYLTVKLNVLDRETATSKAPEYKYNQDAMESFLFALTKKHTVETDGITHSIALGTTIEIPSLKDFIEDDYTVYEDLQVDLYYATPNADSFGTKTEMKLPISDPGEYLFFVMFEDAEGNKIEKSNFIIEKEGEEDTINTSAYGEKFIFSFTVNDDAPITITPAKQGKGYKGTSYTASKFTVDASGCTITYKLFYNSSLEANENSEWIEIPAASTITDVDYEENGYDYDDIMSIAYNGNLTFTPDKIGSYMIECTAVSKTTSKQEVARSIIKIGDEPTYVKPASEWLQNNVWSVVFLSVGTLCLIGIIILLCIKPKERKED